MDGGLWHCTGDRNQDHPQEKEMLKGKMAVWRGLTVKRREAKGKGEKERYTHFNAEFQRIAERYERLSLLSMQINRGKQQNGKN